MPNNALPEFQQFLLSRGLVPEKKILYYAHWVRKFLAFSNSNENLNYDLRVQKFMDELRSQTNTADRQIIQAEEALALYSGHFLKGDTSVLSPNMPQGGKKLPDLPQALDEMRQAIRIKHYSYSTERSYLDWVKRFYDYTLNIKKERCQREGQNCRLFCLSRRYRICSSMFRG